LTGLKVSIIRNAGADYTVASESGQEKDIPYLGQSNQFE
jgi:hypothetical protein